MAVLNPPVARHSHDCDDCILIANLGTNDVYVCRAEESEEDSILARYDDPGECYSSFCVSSARMVADQSADWDLRVRLYDAFIAGRESL